MGRIRTIKPEFFTSRSLARVSRDARLTFAGLWTQADDHGRGVADTRILKGAIWPLDDGITRDDIAAHLQELLSTGHLTAYTVDGELYFEVRGWAKHQASAYRRGEARFPTPADGTVCTFLHDSARSVVRESAYREGKGQDGQDARVADALTAYTMSVCLETKNTNQRYRDSVYDNAVRERGPVLKAHLELYPDASVDDLRELLGLTRLAPREKVVRVERDPNCEFCGGEGVRTIDASTNTMGPCDCTPTLATVHTLKAGSA